jgi:lysine biosynthesis protein LysW
MANCPECEAPLDFEEEDVEEGDVINCPDCNLELEVVHKNPIEVERVEEEEEEEDAPPRERDEEDDLGNEEEEDR